MSETEACEELYPVDMVCTNHALRCYKEFTCTCTMYIYNVHVLVVEESIFACVYSLSAS